MQGDILSLGNKTKKTPSSTPVKGVEKDAGSALRQAYQKTVDEKFQTRCLTFSASWTDVRLHGQHSPKPLNSKRPSASARLPRA